jgi:hypothetical protein
MKVIFAVLIFLTANLSAQWLVLKPTQFEPLTSLPWEQKDATLDKVLGAIFREPNQGIRHRVLDEYLRTIPVESMGAAFELCVPLEGTQTPNDLVARFISIWAKRDPGACWEWVKKLFRLIGIENGVLGYDSWKLPKITVQDLTAIRASPFWIQSRALTGFPIALTESKLSKSEKVRMMKEFVEMWFTASSSWPAHEGDDYVRRLTGENGPDATRALIGMLSRPIAPDMLEFVGESNRSVYEIAFRRMLQADPASAPAIVKKAGEKRPLPYPLGNQGYQGPSDELLLIWAKSDLPGMIRWADSLDAHDQDLAVRAKGLFLSFADATTRNRWFAKAQPAHADQENVASLFFSWAQWDLEGALAAAAKVENPKATRGIANAAAYGPWVGQPWNQSRYAFRVLSNYDYSKLPPKIYNMVFDYCLSLMEQWDSMDAASAAQFGFDYLLRTHYVPREGLIRFFSGNDIYGREDGMIDRTFCALRAWAVVRPDEMKKWISKVRDVEMRKALTWLLENPWGTGEEE